MGRGSPNLRKNTAFWKIHLESTQSIEIEEENAWEWDDMIFKNNHFKPKFLKTKFLAYSKNFQAIN